MLMWAALLTAVMFFGSTWQGTGRAQGIFINDDVPPGARSGAHQPAGPFVPGRMLVSFRVGTSNERARGLLAAHGARTANKMSGVDVHIVELPPAANEQNLVQTFNSSPEVEFAELDHVLAAQQLTPNDPLYTSQSSWSLRKIKGPEAWAVNSGSGSVVIAILDTGVDGTHEELAGKLVPGWNVFGNNADVGDVQGHGTMVSGTAAASSNNNTGVASVAWGCSIMPVRVSDDHGYATDSNIADGLVWAADHGARVANVSYNIVSSATVSRAARYFQRKGGVVTIAAGNQGAFYEMADDPYILTVGATDPDDLLYPWSNRGGSVDLVAPGNGYTIASGGGYAVGTGTSYASPMVAGAAALLFSLNPGLTPAQVQDILKQSADDLGAPGCDTSYGCGRLNLERALLRCPGSGAGFDTAPPVDAIISPTEGAVVSSTVTVQVDAWDDVGVKKVELYVDGVLSGTSTTAPFAIKWSARRAAGGPHTLLSKAYDSAGNVGVSLPVTVHK
jgi:thermitase